MRKTIRRLAAWVCCLCMAAGAVTAAWAQETDYAQMERELVEAQRQQLTDGEPLLTRQDVLPAGQSSVADWYAIAMARCGISEDYETYLAALKAYVESAYAESGGLSANKATEWHRVALAAALVCLLPVTALADAETQPALLLSASQTLVERYNTFTVDVFLTGTPGADILPAAETHIDCDNASVEATSAGTAANSKITADGTAVTLSYYGEESAVFDESGRFLLGTITLKAGRSGIATVTASRTVGTVDGLTDVDIPAASGFSGVCSVTIYHYSSSATEEPVGSPKTGDMGALAYCAMCAASGAGTAALWLRRRGKRG